ncbi:unnamed protein product [Adineta steineri]|uniref:Aldehyde dehydrogenase domain-containing protein n=1 Tax=Adineta steineri TaxID=433720 RepID=A0A815EUF6_9BILA|nr:unnamed protein product [Adineta steineri]CAF1317040.1 unnamed protein product [Adineta steineri]
MSPLPDIEIKYTEIFINNEWHKADKGKTFPVINPSTGEVIANVEEATRTDVDKAVEAARKAFHVDSPWRTMQPADRGALMRKFAELLRRDIKYLAQLETLNNGKPVHDSMGDIGLSANCIDYYAGWVDKITGETIPAGNGHFLYTEHEPVGICGQIIPWNFPILMLAWKLGPALACGNTVILKPAEQTPLSALYCAALIKEAGFPPGVVNIVPGDGPECGNAIVVHPHVDKLAFTGSSEIGRLIQETAAKHHHYRVSLELGGKSALIICEDADLDYAAKVAHQALYFNAAQCCCAGSRTYVHAKIYDEFVAKCVELANKRVVGDPYDRNTEQGPQVSEEQFNKILGYIEAGNKEGAKLECGGKRACDKGYFIQPTVFSGVKDDMKIAREEIFGPVMSLLKYDCYEDVIKRANSSSFGLAAGIVTKDLTRALTITKRLHAGTIWINDYNTFWNQAPFGGFKQSGHGRELGSYGLEGYYEVKTVSIKLA